MQKFEYSVVILRHPESAAAIHALNATLNSLGSEGWELVTMTPAGPDQRLCYFKRPRAK